MAKSPVSLDPAFEEVVRLIEAARQRATRAVNVELIELSRQIDAALFERSILTTPKLSVALRELHPDAPAVFREVPTPAQGDRNLRSPCAASCRKGLIVKEYVA